MTQKSSRCEQNVGGQLIPNPAKRFLEPKNNYTVETITTAKGKKTEVKAFDSVSLGYSEKNGEEWEQKTLDLPIEFAILNGDWVNFKGWNDTDKCKYWSNEVKDNTSTITIRNKEGIVFEFTLKEMWEKVPGTKNKTENAKNIAARLKELNVKQHSSIYIVLRGTDEIINLQLKGSNLSGSKDPENQPSGWWNVSKKFKPNNNLYKYWFQINDWLEETTDIGTFGILNFTQGELISKEDGVSLDALFDELAAYHEFYTNKPELVKEESEVAISEDI
jgi:hypothetical protein